MHAAAGPATSQHTQPATSQHTHTTVNSYQQRQSARARDAGARRSVKMTAVPYEQLQLNTLRARARDVGVGARRSVKKTAVPGSAPSAAAAVRLAR